MKKFALGILSVFMILGGVLLSGCDKKVSLSVSDKEVVIYTNYEQAENNKTKEIEVDVKNSKLGVNVEIERGSNCIDIQKTHTTSKKANGKYAFTIVTKDEKNSGFAQIKVTSIDDSKKYEYIDISVKTVIEDFELAKEDSTEGKSDRFVVRGVDKELVTTDYFDLTPIYANVVDIDWTFADGEKEFYIDQKLCAQIDGTTLKVSPDYTLAHIDVRANYVLNKDLSRTVTLEVLDNSTIRTYSVDDNVFYQNGDIRATEATVSLKRNNSNFSSVNGELVLDASETNTLNLKPIVYKVDSGKPVLMTNDEFERYFVFDYYERSTTTANTKAYNFSIDAIDENAKKVFGKFEFYLDISYAGYNYSVSTLDTKLVLDISYAATVVELTDGDGYSINNTIQDVFSSYENSFGYEVNTVIGPTDVAIDDRFFRISIDVNQSALAGLGLNQANPISDVAQFFTANGTPITFTQSAGGSAVYVSSAIESGAKIFVRASDRFDEIDEVEIKFESRSNASASTSLFLTFFKISEDKTMTVESATEEALEERTFLSSSISSPRRLDFTVRITGIATDSGLSIRDDKVGGFEYSPLTLLSKSEEGADVNFVVVSFSVTLTDYNFARVSTFWFEHITGKKSSNFLIETFVPIESVTIQNADKASASVFADESVTQNYVFDNGTISRDSTKQSYSLSRIMLEAGASLPIYTSCQNATLTENGISYKFLTFESLKTYLSVMNAISDPELLDHLANEAISSGSVELVAVSNALAYFGGVDTSSFSISSDMITLSNLTFKGFVAVFVEGYTENHEVTTLVRFFSLESFYSVRYLSSNVKTALLYTADTLSINDINRSVVDVTISMRQDNNVPTYADSLEYFSFTSPLQELVDVSGNRTMWQNDFYSISNVAISNGGKNLTFRISAKSTNLQTSVNDILRIVYLDEHGFQRTAEIQLEIRNVTRLESVQWVNKTVDGEIYLNLTSANEAEKNFTISTSVEPTDANDTGLTYLYVADSGSGSDIRVSTSAVGQIFNISINTTTGGRGTLYLLPNDMIKNVDGFNHILVYKYIENEDGSIVETPLYIPLSDLGTRFDEIIAGSDDISNYFYNNDKEKVYYQNIILQIRVTIADGNSEGTAIRVYNQGDLEGVDRAKYYRVMNDITLNAWKAYDSFSGMIFGDNNDITIKFTNGSENFVNELDGTLKDLIFAGEVTVGSLGDPVVDAGFIANRVLNRNGKMGRIENCSVDVYYSSAENKYYGSKLTAHASVDVGMIAGVNDGIIEGAYVYGGSIDATEARFVGGLVGENNGTISNSGFEFYKFEVDEESGEQNSNKISTAGNVGGLVGFAGTTSVVETSYVYAFALPFVKQITDASTLDYDVSNIIEAEGVVGVLASTGSNGARFSQVFGYLGNVSTAFITGTDEQFVTLADSYITYYNPENEKICSNIYKLVSYSYANKTQVFDQGTDTNWTILTDPSSAEESARLDLLRLDENVWNLEKTDSDVNFGFIYLRNVTQSKAVNLDDVHVADSKGDTDDRWRVLNAGEKLVGEDTFETGIFFIFNPINQVVDVAEKAMLDRLNTISLAKLFGISDEQAGALLLTSESRNISLSANSVRLLSPTLTEFEISAHSKMDFTQSKKFKFIVMNVLPTLTTMIDGISLKDNQMILLQTEASRTVVYSALSSLYLNGTTAYDLTKDEFEISVDGTGDKFVEVTRSSNSIVLKGLERHENDNRTTISTALSHEALSKDSNSKNYADVVNDKITRTFDVRVYNGAKSLEITNANNLIIRPYDLATFGVILETDAEQDGLVFSLNYDEIEIQGQTDESNADFVRFEVDSNLTLEVSWAGISSVASSDVLKNQYNVYVRVSDDTKYKVDKDYSDLVLSVNALSQASNNTYKRYINLKVETQPVEDISISTYAIERRQIRSSILYLMPSSNVVNTLSPASDAIVSVALTPQFAKATHFTLTYEVTGTSVGTIGLSRLVYNSMYGYYVNSSSTLTITNGIRVNLTDADKTGDGLFYFRLYVSSSFTSTSTLKLVTTFYDGETVVKEGSQNLTIDYLQDAVVRVEGASTYLLAKGGTAMVTVRIGTDQTLSDLYLQNNESSITLNLLPDIEVSGNYKTYTAELYAPVTATLSGGKESGVFYVCASVKKTLNNSLDPEEKVSRAMVCLVDFSIDTNGISVAGSGNKRTYNGRSYDAFNAYINDKSELHFNYPLLPAEYNYDKNDTDAVRAVASLTAKRNQFLNNNYYRDADSDYSINCMRNPDTGIYDPITLKEQLWTGTNESYMTKIYNPDRNSITQSDFFTITEETLVDGSTRLMVSGKRAGTQLMRLTTYVNYQGTEIYADYYFLIVVEVWTDEESPTQITTGEEFVDYATNSEEAGDYILMNDIVLSDYTPVSTDLINSFDGNGFTIHLNSFRMPTDDSSLRLALFDNVASNTTLKNVRVNIYNGGQIFVNIKQYTNVDIAGFALSNDGVIYNCEVVAYYDEDYQISQITGNSGLVVKYTNGANTTPIPLTTQSGVESVVSGFVSENNASIMNSRVGGDNFKHVIIVDETSYLETQKLEVFYLEGQGEVSGFVNTNAGYVSASFVKNIQIYNIMEYDASITAGFVARNSQSVQNSYVEGLGGEMQSTEDGAPEKEIVYNRKTNISSLGIIAGFVYENNALVKNSYANIGIKNDKTKGSMVAGFVYRNNEDGEVTLCYAACEIEKTDITQMQFSGVDDFTNSLNYGTISLSYFYNESRADDSLQSKVTTSAVAITDVDQTNSFYGFSFSSDEGFYNGIWEMRSNQKISLVSANQIAISNRYAVTNGRITSIFYSRSIRDIDTLEYVDLSYGSESNPIILRDADDFAKATGKATSVEISSYKEYYTDTEVTGRYRIVNNIDMTDIAQDAEDEGSVKLQTSTKVFKGLLDGNGFTISNISLGSSDSTSENFGLFARLSGAVIMNLDLTVESVHNAQANIVGVLAGTAVNSRILAITLSPTEGETEGQSTAVQGYNIVGGVVGMLFGDSYLSDITVSNVDVSAEGYKEEKGIHDNRSYIEGGYIEGAGDTKSLRTLVEDLDNGTTLQNNVKDLSYAGAVVGFVDIYSSIDESYIAYSSAREVNSYDILTVHVLHSVNIYAEVAGGLFGYVGKSTLIYDATLSVDQNQARTEQGNSSYIISKNLFAGGLVGENYGGLFAVSASYEKELQDDIEEQEHSYYANQNTGAERGQMSIFSYTPSDEGYLTRRNRPLFVGGLVGYMGGGYIYVAQSKLNVISHTGATVGGVVGLSGVSGDRYDLTFTNERRPVNVLYYEVYASGDIYSENSLPGAGALPSNMGGFSGGIIGALESDGVTTSIIAMKSVMAMNYYSYDGVKLTSDTNEIVGTYNSTNHYMLVGKMFDNTQNTFKAVTDYVQSDMFIISSINDIVLNVKNGDSPTADMGSNTVGGYTTISFGEMNAALPIFGFSSPASSMPSLDPEKDVLTKTILEAQHISAGELESMSSAYSRMRSYFISNGWDTKYWTHYQNKLFPEIVLLPKININFWDIDNTEEILEELASGTSTSTFVVRGREKHNDDNCLTYKDIDLTSSEYSFKTISNFSGRLVSYATYMNSAEGGRVTNRDPNDNGGAKNDRVGIILDKPMFEKISANATIEGLPFYFVSQGERKGFSLIESEAEDSLIRDIDIVLNDSMTISATPDNEHTDNGNYVSVGLVVGLANSTSFYDIAVKFRSKDGETPTLTFDSSVSTTTSTYTHYMGLLAGRINQMSSRSQMTISGVSIGRTTNAGDGPDVKPSEEPVDITFKTKITAETNQDRTQDRTLYAGLYAGEVLKSGSGASITIGVRQINGVNIHIESEAQLPKVELGGYIGKLSGADRVELVEGDSDDKDGLGISMFVENINNLYAGLAFGESSTKVEFSFDNVPNAWMIGRIFQVEGKSVTNARIGSIMGFNSSGNIELTSARVKFDVANELMYGTKKAEQTTEEQLEQFNENIKNIITENEYDYSGLKTFSLDGGEDTYIGGVVGYSTGTITVNGVSNIQGNLLVNAKTNIYIGGIIGRFNSANDVTIGGEVTNETNIFVENAGATSYVGGVVGEYSDTGAELEDAAEFEIGEAIENSFPVQYNGSIVISGSGAKYVGGAVGSLLSKNENSAEINGFAFGGAVRVLATNSTSLTVGGVVGTFDKVNPKEVTNTAISNSASYGDVFVIYPIGSKKLMNTYIFGGIVGIAQEGVTISGCSTILTDFNSGETDALDAKKIGAIVGTNQGLVTYSNNAYSSIVMRTFQEVGEGNNVDCGYGVSQGYEGYTTKTGAETFGSDGQGAETLSAMDILMRFGSGLTNDRGEGHKLNPRRIVTFDGKDLNDPENEMTEFNGLRWVAITENLTNFTTVFADNLTNMVIVGNGKTIAVETNADHEVSSGIINLGGLVNSMGLDADKDRSTAPNFNMISGLLLNLNIADNISSAGNDVNAFGGVTGYMKGDSYIYGVGVKGDLSVGGASNLYLGGIAGVIQQGRIDQCYVDADIVYRGKTSGFVSGIATIGDKAVVISSTYSSGKITSYVSAPIFTFAYATGPDQYSSSEQAEQRIYDCYSITQVEQKDIMSNTSSAPTVYFANIKAKGNKYPFQDSNGQVLNGTAGINESYDNGKTFEYTKSTDMALSYKDDAFFRGKSLLKSDFYNGNALKSDEDINKLTASQNTWYFSRFTNYGYASHGFGYLKNSTTYTAEGDNDTGYKYVPVAYSELLTNDFDTNGNPWYLGLQSAGKFKQMMETIKYTEEEVNNTAPDSRYKTDKYKFVLRYGFSLSGEYSGSYAAESYNGNSAFSFDGNGNTIDLAGVTMKTGLFSTLRGVVKNLRLVNGSMSLVQEDEKKPDTVGFLANIMMGDTKPDTIDLEDITVIGEITNEKSSMIGGVVGSLGVNETESRNYVTARRIESLVNIESNGGVVGGAFGNVFGSVDYVSSTGVLNNKGGDVSPATQITAKIFKIAEGISDDTESEKINAVTGGIAGQLESYDSDELFGKITNSYNANSVLSNFDSKGSHEALAGGIVGYVKNGVITSCYNVGLVGAGNYNSTGLAYAGGIVGYAYNVAMSEVINDGPVQALSSQDSDFNIDTKVLDKGTAVVDSPEVAPHDYKVEITMTYNPEDERLVNAYGLGFAEKSEKINDIQGINGASTTNNVKNDGNVGEIITTSYLLFNRNQMLDNDKNKYQATFNTDVGTNSAKWKESQKDDAVEETVKKVNLNVSGYDSYGFPARVYGIDTITRSLSSNHPFYKFLIGRLETSTNIDFQGGILRNIEMVYHGQVDFKGSQWEKNNSMSGGRKIGGREDLNFGKNTTEDKEEMKTIERAGMSASTAYYTSSVLSAYWNYSSNEKTLMEFDGYDSILQQLNKYSKYVNGRYDGGTLNNKLKVGDSGNAVEAIRQIKAIDEEIEKDSEESGVVFINVAGTDIGIAKSADHLKTILTPHCIELGVITFDISGADSINTELITKTAVSFTGMTPQYAEYDVVVDSEAKKVYVVRSTKNDEDKSQGPKLYFAQEPSSKNFRVELNVSGGTSFVLSDNNCDISGNDLVVRLDKLDSEVKERLLEYASKKPGSVGENEESYEFKSASIGDISSLTPSVDTASRILRISGLEVDDPELQEKINGQELVVNVLKNYFVQSSGNVVFNVKNNTQPSDDMAGVSGSDSTFTIKNYAEQGGVKAFPDLSAFTNDGENYTISTSNFISAVGLSGKEFAYEVSGEYNFSLYWNGANFTFGRTPSGVTLSQSGSQITVGGNAQKFIDWASTQRVTAYTLIEDASGYVKSEENINTVSINQTIFGGILSLRGEADTTAKHGFTLSITGGAYTGLYNGTTDDFETLTTHTESGIEVTPLTVGGITITKMRSIKATFGYNFSATLTNSARGKSFELQIQRGGQTVGVKYFGGAFGDSSGAIDGIKAGDILVKRDSTVDFEREIVGLNYAEELILLNPSAETETYTITKGSEDIFGASRQRYVRTQWTKRDDRGEVSEYQYTIYENGIIWVEYKVATPSKEKDGELETQMYDNFIYLPNSINAGSRVDDKGVRISWDSCSTGFYALSINTEITSKTYKFEHTVQYSEIMQDGEMAVDLIALDFGDSVTLISAPTRLTTAANFNDAAEIDLSENIGLSYGISKETISINRGDDLSATLQGELAYTIDKGGKRTGQFTNQYNREFSTNHGDTSGTYDVSWTAKFTKTGEEKNSSSDGSNDAKIILLAHNIVVDPGFVLNKSIIGNNYVVRFSSDGTSLFNNIENQSSVEQTKVEQTNVRDIVFAGTCAATNETTALFAATTSTTGVFSNVDLYGSIRNVPYSSTNTVYGDGPTVTESGFTSNVTVVGLDAIKDKSVDCTLSMNSTNGIRVLIAGDAVKASNAGTSFNVYVNSSGSIKRMESATSERDGKKGADGQKGGAISNEKGAICHAGFSSIGGYGGDGSHGRFISGKAMGGGAAGAAGVDNTTNLHKGSKTQLGGHTGIGGFGRIGDISSSNNNCTMYTSANGGKGKTRGADGQTITPAHMGRMGTRQDNGAIHGGYDTFFAAYATTLGQNDGSCFKSQFEDYGNCSNGLSDWETGIENGFKSIKPGYNVNSYGGISGNTSGQPEGTYVTVKSMYTYSHVSCFADNEVWLFYQETNVSAPPQNQWYRIAWCSGETVNSSGAFTDYSGTPYSAT